MARTKSPKRHDSPSTPLADYFWIAGVDGQDIFDTYVRLGNINSGPNGVEDTIEEEKADPLSWITGEPTSAPSTGPHHDELSRSRRRDTSMSQATESDSSWTNSGSYSSGLGSYSSGLDSYSSGSGSYSSGSDSFDET